MAGVGEEHSLSQKTADLKEKTASKAQKGKEI